MSSPAPPLVRRGSSTLRLAAVATSICLTATGLAFAWNHWSTPALRPAPWWLVTIVGSGFAFAQIAQFSVVVGKERLNFVFAEIPAAFALVYLAPWQMALSWLIGPVMVQAFQHRTVWFKLVFNGSANLVRAGAAIGLIRLWDTAALSAADLVRIALAIAVAEAFASTIASAFIRWASGRKPRAAAMDVTVATGQSVVGASLGAWALLAADEHPALLALPAVVVALIWQFARQQWADRQAYQDLLEVHGFLTTVAGIEARDVAADGLQRLRTILGCTWIALVDDGGEPVEGAGRLPDGIGDLVDLEVEERARRSLLSCPLRNGRVILAGPPAAGGSYTRRDRRRFQTAADLFDAALERAELQLKLEHDATHDPLTDLLARGGFTRAADRILNGRSGHGAVIVVDLARFTEVNNTLGFKAGDILLRQTAERLTDVLGEHRVVARLDGDAFAVFLPLDDADAILGIAGQLRQALQEPIRVRGLGLSLLVRLGIAVGPGHGTTSESLLRAADVAAELARDAQPPIVIYRAEADLHSESRLELLSRVRRALETEAFEVWYQPKVDTISGLVVGVEALVRWFDDGRWISPDEFIPTAEAAGMMSELTHHVLRNALAVVARLRHRGFELSVAVNLSPSTLEDPGLHDRIVAELTRFGIQPPSLTVEITESVVMGTGEVAAGALQRLRQLGVRLSVDDFGTGYSSLRYLKELDVDELKLDRSFVQDLDVSDRSERIARAVIGLGHTLGLRVVAEGVETPNARAMLQQMGCDVLQGYLIGRPMDAERLEEWLRRHKSAARPGRDQEPTPSDRRPVGRSDS